MLRTFDNPPVLFQGAGSLGRVVNGDHEHPPLGRPFPEVRIAAVRILDHTFPVDLCCSHN